MKKAIDLWAHAGEILETVGKGVLLTTKVGDRVTHHDHRLGVPWESSGKPLSLRHLSGKAV